VFPLHGELFHITRSENRESIRTQGLNWERMGSVRGIAGSGRFEIPVNFLESAAEGCEWWVRMARAPLDIWAVYSTGLWGENGTDDGIVVAAPIEPWRLRLVESYRVARDHESQ